MNNELLSVVSYLERERGVNREVIIQAIESAVQQAARKSLEVSNDLRVVIDRKTLEIKAYDMVYVSDDDTGIGFITLRAARRIKPDVASGETIEVEVPVSSSDT
jgi:N utilization substance protein A